MTMIRTILAALATTALLMVAAPAVATDGQADDPINNTPTTEHVKRAEGTKALGFRVYMDDATMALYPTLGRMLYRCNTANDAGTDAATACRQGWRDFYAGLVQIRNADPTPDYNPYH